MERLQALVRKYRWWLLMVVGLGLIWLVASFFQPGAKELSLSDFQAKAAQHQVQEAVINASDHHVDATLRDGKRYVVQYPSEYDDELTTFLTTKNVQFRVIKPSFFEANGATIGSYAFLTVVLFGAFAIPAIRTRLMARQRLVYKVSDKSFADVLGADGPVSELQQMVHYLKHPREYEDAGVRAPRGWLFYGPTGTGKTLMAEAVAGEAGVPFYAYSGSDFGAKYIGEGVSRINAMFKVVGKGPAIIFIDEIDVIGSKRSEDDHLNDIRNQLLVQMDGFLSKGSQVVIIGATNRKEALDPAILRPGRLTRHLFMPEPDIAARTELLRRACAELPNIDPNINVERLSKRMAGMTGAEVNAIVNLAGMTRLRLGGGLVTDRDIETALADHTLGQERRGTLILDEDREIAAVHEAGHAITALLLPGAPKPEEVSIIPRGQSGGATWMVDEERAFMRVDDVKARLAVCLGSRAAERLKFGANFSIGAAHDLQTASELARRAICEWGLGSVHDFIPVQYWNEDPRALEIAVEVEEWLREAESTATTLLDQHNTLLERVRERLLEAEVINGEMLRTLARELQAL